MKANIYALQHLAESRKWSTPYLAERLGVDYSYLFRVFKGEKSGGKKLYSGIYRLCRNEGLSIDDFISWDEG